MAWHGVLVVCRGVLHHHTRERRPCLTHFVERHVAGQLQVHRFAVSAKDRHPHRGARQPDGGVAENFFGFLMHLHFLPGVAVVHEHVAMRQAILVDGVWIHPRWIQACALSIQLVHGRLAGSCDALIRAHHAAFNSPLVVDRLEAHHQLHGGAVGVGQDQILRLHHFSVDFRHHQFVVVRHAPSAAVVHHGNPCGRELGRPFQTQHAAGGKQRHVRFQ